MCLLAVQVACTGNETEQWIYDGLGRIHSKAEMDQCLTNNGNVVSLASCSTNKDSQVWDNAFSNRALFVRVVTALT